MDGINNLRLKFFYYLNWYTLWMIINSNHSTEVKRRMPSSCYLAQDFFQRLFFSSHIRWYRERWDWNETHKEMVIMFRLRRDHWRVTDLRGSSDGINRWGFCDVTRFECQSMTTKSKNCRNLLAPPAIRLLPFHQERSFHVIWNWNFFPAPKIPMTPIVFCLLRPSTTTETIDSQMIHPKASELHPTKSSTWWD